MPEANGDAPANKRWLLQWAAGGGGAILACAALWQAIQKEGAENRKYFREQLAKQEAAAALDRGFIQTKLMEGLTQQAQTITMATTTMSTATAAQTALSRDVADLAEQQQDFLLKIEPLIAKLNASVRNANASVRDATELVQEAKAHESPDPAAADNGT